MSTGLNLFGLLGLFCVLAPVLVGLWLIVRGVRGRLLLSAPRCRKCGQDLRRPDAAWERCPECGTDLGDGRFVAFGRARRRPKLVVLGCLALLLGPPVMLLGLRGAVALMQRASGQTAFAFTGPPGSPQMLQAATDDVVLATLVTNWNEPWAWQEIDKRRNDGRIDDASLAAALADAITAIEATELDPTGLSWGDDYIRRWRVAGIVDDALDRRIRMASIRPMVQMPLRVRAGERAELMVANGGSRIPALILIERVRVEGGGELPVEFTAVRRGGRTAPAGIVGPMGNARGTVTMALEPGAYELVMDLEIGLLDAIDGAVMRTAAPPARAEWPADMPTARRTMRRSVTVVPETAPLVETAIRDSQRETVRAILEPEGVAAEVFQDRVQFTLVMPNEGTTPPIALAFRVKVVVGERSWTVATISMHGGGRSRSGGSDQVRVEDLDDSTERVDVLFEPYFEEVRKQEQMADLLYWGEPVLFEDVPLRWY